MLFVGRTVHVPDQTRQTSVGMWFVLQTHATERAVGMIYVLSQHNVYGCVPIRVPVVGELVV